MTYVKKSNKSNMISIAKQLGYPSSVIERIKDAKNDIEAQNIMITARRNLQ